MGQKVESRVSKLERELGAGNGGGPCGCQRKDIMPGSGWRVVLVDADGKPLRDDNGGELCRLCGRPRPTVIIRTVASGIAEKLWAT